MAIVQVSVVDGVGFQALVPTGQELLGIELHRKSNCLVGGLLGDGGHQASGPMESHPGMA